MSTSSEKPKLTLFQDRLTLLLIALWLVPTIAVPWLAFSTEISQEALAERVLREYPDAFRPAIRDGSPSADIVNGLVQDQNWQMLSESERELYADEVWIERRIPLAAALWFAGFFAIIFLRRDKIRAAASVHAAADANIVAS